MCLNLPSVVAILCLTPPPMEAIFSLCSAPCFRIPNESKDSKKDWRPQNNVSEPFPLFFAVFSSLLSEEVYLKMLTMTYESSSPQILLAFKLQLDSCSFLLLQTN